MGVVRGEDLSGVLGKLIGANMNTTNDQAITIRNAGSPYVIRRIVATNASLSLSVAQGGLYTAASKGGSGIVGNTQVYAALTSGTKFLDLTLGVITDILTGGTLYLSLILAQGSAATCDFYLIGDVLE